MPIAVWMTIFISLFVVFILPTLSRAEEERKNDATEQ